MLEADPNLSKAYGNSHEEMLRADRKRNFER